MLSWAVVGWSLQWLQKNITNEFKTNLDLDPIVKVWQNVIWKDHITCDPYCAVAFYSFCSLITSWLQSHSTDAKRQHSSDFFMGSMVLTQCHTTQLRPLFKEPSRTYPCCLVPHKAIVMSSALVQRSCRDGEGGSGHVCVREVQVGLGEGVWRRRWEGKVDQ